MARPRTASNILEAKGAFKKNPNRARPSEPVVKTKFPKLPPKHLSAASKKCWKEIIKIAPAGVLTGADVLLVEVTANLLAEYRASTKTNKPMDTPRITRLMTELNKIGLDPGGRAKLSVEKPKKNSFDDL